MDKIKGFKFSGINCGIKNSNKDLGLIYCEKGASFAAVTTKNKFASPSVKYTKEIVQKHEKIKYVLVNSGNANALTGDEGYKDIKEILKAVDNKLQPHPHINEALMLSTGIIGKRLPVEKIKAGIPILLENLEGMPLNFAKAICTTDTFEKMATETIFIDGKQIHIEGIAKGSGMIQPNMATMLAMICTDATVEVTLLREVIQEVCDKSFNKITVDSDSSTNDSFLILASNEGATVTKDDLEKFKAGLVKVAENLARQIIRDGEGATKMIEIKIKNSKNITEAKNIFLAVANSPLVKIAFFGENPNFGRILCSTGKIKSSIKPEKVSLLIGDIVVVKNGVTSPSLPENQEKLNTYMREREIQIVLNLNNGDSEYVGWTCDLSHEYIRINAEYN